MKVTVVTISWWICTALMGQVGGDLFTSISAMERLFDRKRNIVTVVESFVEGEAQKHQILIKMAQDYHAKTNELMQNTDGANFENPVAAYLILKRLAAVWAEIEDTVGPIRNLTKEDVIKELKQVISNLRLSIPGEADVEGAAMGLVRLQDTYNLSTKEMADGRFPGVPYFGALNGKDCYYIGLQTANKSDDYHTVLWLEEALKRIQDEHPPSIKEIQILEHLPDSYYRQNMTPRAIFLAKRLLELSPNHENATKILEIYESRIRQIHQNGTDEERERLDAVADGSVWSPEQLIRYVPKYLNLHQQALCRGEETEEVPDLICYYKTNTQFLRLAPFKVEVASWDPAILLYREVIYQTEIDIIVKAAARNMSRSQVNGRGGNVAADYRTSQNAWLKDHQNDIVDRITRRVGEMIDLDMEHAEMAQVANYGIGGHYELHHDSALHYVPIEKQSEIIATRYNKTRTADDRIATVMFYLIQPIAGGATIFPEIDTSIPATAGDAVFWYNVMRNGYSDPLVTHLACPVMTGQKWVLNKWISVKNQEILYPCSLDEEE